MIVTTINDILHGICKKHNRGCNWEARRYVWFNHVKITKYNLGKPDKIEFRTRLNDVQNKDPNVEFVKLKKPVMSSGDHWYVGEYKKSKKSKNKKSKNKKSKNKKSKNKKSKKSKKANKSKKSKNNKKANKSKKSKKSKNNKSKKSKKNKNLIKVEVRIPY